MKSKLLSIFTLLFLINLVSALNVELSVNPEFNEGDTLSFNFSIQSSINETISYMPAIYCPNFPIPTLFTDYINLTENLPYNGNYTFLLVNSLTESQECMAILEIEKYNIHKESKFRINTQPSFDVNIQLCEDQNCLKKSKTFIQDAKIYLDYESEVVNPYIEGILIYPNNSEKKLTLPTDISLSQIGVYSLVIKISKEEYKDNSKTIKFSVISDGAIISNIQDCNSNLICDENENYNTCPQECNSGVKDGYCDKVKDNICDPDCDSAEDIDCPTKKPALNETKEEVMEDNKTTNIANKTMPKEEIKKKSPYKMFLILLLLIMVIILILVIIKRRNKPENNQRDYYQGY